MTRGAKATTSRRTGLLFAVCASVLFASNGIASKAVLLAGMPALRFTELRVTGTFVLLIAYTALTRPDALRIRRPEVVSLVVYGIVGIVFVQTFYFVAIRQLPVGIALLIEYTAPIMVALWAQFAQHRRLPRSFWLGLSLAMVGLVMVAQVWRGATLSTVGVLAAFAAAMSLALYFVVGERAMTDGTRDRYSFTAWGFGFGALLLALIQPWWSYPWSILAGTSTVIEGLPAIPVWLLAVWVVVLGTLVPYLLTLSSLGHLSATGSSVASMLEPVLAGVFAWILLSESLAPIQVAGAAVVLGGIVVAELAGGRSMPTESAITSPLDTPSSPAE